MSSVALNADFNLRSSCLSARAQAAAMRKKRAGHPGRFSVLVVDKSAPPAVTARLPRMCGICGVVAAERERGPDREAVARMSGRLVHRGPDDEGLFCDGPAAPEAPRVSVIYLPLG